MKTDNTALFAEVPVNRAVLSLAVPTVISQLINVVYNMADTFFVGQVGDPNQVAAASLALPLFLLTTGVANLFGIGGASLISRSLGAGDQEKARRTSVFCIYTSGAVALLYGLFMLAFRSRVLPIVGADQDTFDFCSQYLFWTICVGAVPTVLNPALAHLVRAEGFSGQASFGVAMGGILNIILDPVFIFGFGQEIRGAAIATMLSNLIATLYYAVFIFRKRTQLCLTFDPRLYTLGDGIPGEVLMVGLPSSVLNLMSIFSNVMMNRLMVSYSNAAVAAIGIAKKVDLVAFAVANGLSQGVIPLVGYNYTSGNHRRMRAAIRFTLTLSLTVTIIGAVVLFTCATPVVRAFINDAETIRYGCLFQRIICITGPFTAVTMVIITIFQAVGRRIQPMVLSFLRKGGLDVPFMFLMNRLVGVSGIAWATPIADTIAMLASVCLFLVFWRGLDLGDGGQSGPELDRTGQKAH